MKFKKFQLYNYLLIMLSSLHISIDFFVLSFKFRKLYK